MAQEINEDKTEFTKAEVNHLKLGVSCLQTNIRRLYNYISIPQEENIPANRLYELIEDNGAWFESLFNVLNKNIRISEESE